MSRLTFDDVRRALPDLDELRPLLDHLLATSEPDPERRWSGSGEVDAAANRLVDAAPDAGVAVELARREERHLAALYEAALDAVARMGSGDYGGAARALLTAAGLEELRQRPERAEAYAAAAHRAADKAGEPRTLALALRRQARAARAQGALRRAEKSYASAYQIASGVGDARGSAEAAIGAGNVLEEEGRWTAAETWYHRALAELGRLEVVPELWHALLNIHVVHRSRGQIEESVPWLRRAEGVAEALADESARPFLANAWGQLSMARGDFDAAVAALREGLGEDLTPRASVTIRLNLAEALLALGRTLDATEEAREAEREALRASLTSLLPEVYRLLGRIASARGNPSSFVLFERALDLVRDRSLPALEEALTLQAYADAQAELGEVEDAERLAERAAELYESLGIPGRRAAWAHAFTEKDRRHGNDVEG